MLLFLALTLQPIEDAAEISVRMLSSLRNFLLESLVSMALSTQPKIPERGPMVRKLPWKAFNEENQMKRK